MFYQIKQNVIILSLKVKANAKKNEITGFLGNYLKIGVNVSPTQGKANQKVCEILSKWLAISQKEIKIVRGLKSKLKIVQIPNELKTQEKFASFSA